MDDQDADEVCRLIAEIMKVYPFSKPIFGDGDEDDDSTISGIVFAVDVNALDRCRITKAPKRKQLN